ncbi:hypothetical protein CC80DRAFT_499044 [Byssothecium circinans]|uniref:Uncharacterized protein n=1 Tax=Byssothecium circinans TaxID=147558 RepID=A0A6A5UDD7_9PLEO|nr:hypothetical protein CC80DRAFT_499044 [Byssothecium circinans]
MSRHQGTDMNDLVSAFTDINPYGTADAMNNLTGTFSVVTLGGPAVQNTTNLTVEAPQVLDGEQWLQQNVFNGDYPPDADDDEQLLILAGVQDYRLPCNGGSAVVAYSYQHNEPYVELPSPPPDFESIISNASLSSAQTAVRQQFAAEMSLEAGKELRECYGWMLNHSLGELADFVLPSDLQELAVLSVFMAEEIHRRCVWMRARCTGWIRGEEKEMLVWGLVKYYRKASRNRLKKGIITIENQPEESLGSELIQTHIE